MERMHWIAGKRPAQHINEMKKGDKIFVTFPDGREETYEVESVMYDTLRNCQITLERK